jgi:hypothetical protein
MNPHLHLDVWVIFQRLANLQRALCGLLRAAEKSSAIPSPVGTRVSLPLLPAARKHSVLRTIWFSSLEQINLVTNQQLRITDHVD